MVAGRCAWQLNTVPDRQNKIYLCNYYHQTNTLINKRRGKSNPMRRRPGSDHKRCATDQVIVSKVLCSRELSVREKVAKRKVDTAACSLASTIAPLAITISVVISVWVRSEVVAGVGDLQFETPGNYRDLSSPTLRPHPTVIVIIKYIIKTFAQIASPWNSQISSCLLGRGTTRRFHFYGAYFYES